MRVLGKTRQYWARLDSASAAISFRFTRRPHRWSKVYSLATVWSLNPCSKINQTIKAASSALSISHALFDNTSPLAIRSLQLAFVRPRSLTSLAFLTTLSSIPVGPQQLQST